MHIACVIRQLHTVVGICVCVQMIPGSVHQSAVDPQLSSHMNQLQLNTPSVRITVRALSHDSLLWPPYGIGQAVIFLPCGFFYLSFFLIFFFPRLISAVAEWMSTILLHMLRP